MTQAESSKALLAPSLLSADFSKLAAEIEEVERAGADWLHVDVMDGHFVPNLTVGPLVVQAIRPKTQLPLDCHLMVSKPEDWIEPFAKAGASTITIHQEASVHLDRQLRLIRSLNCKAGVSLNPGTPVGLLRNVLDLVDLVLIMSVNPGFGGQKFIPIALYKVRELAALRTEVQKRTGNHFLIEIDGGISADTIGQARQAGCDVFVAGNAIFKGSDRAKNIRALRDSLNAVEGKS